MFLDIYEICFQLYLDVETWGQVYQIVKEIATYLYNVTHMDKYKYIFLCMLTFHPHPDTFISL